MFAEVTNVTNLESLKEIPLPSRCPTTMPAKLVLVQRYPFGFGIPIQITFHLTDDLASLQRLWRNIIEPGGTSAGADMRWYDATGASTEFLLSSIPPEPTE